MFPLEPPEPESPAGEAAGGGVPAPAPAGAAAGPPPGLDGAPTSSWALTVSKMVCTRLPRLAVAAIAPITRVPIRTPYSTND